MELSDENTHNSETPPLSLRRSLERITFAGCLAMIWMAAVSSPATTEFFRALGAHELHFGMLAGIPLCMIFMQFVAALMVNRLGRRKYLFMVFNIASRLLYLPVAFLPLLLDKTEWPRLLPWLIMILAASSALGQLAVPLWFSWMGDLIPRRRINSYWGQRHVWLQGTWLVAYLGIFAYTCFLKPSPVQAFVVLAVIGTVAGVADILLFLRVPEPPNLLLPRVKIAELLWQPLRSPQFRAFVLFNCCWMGAVMFAASFMQVYVLKVFELEVWKTTLIWCMAGSGAVVTSRTIGRLADRHGNRPILLIAISLKSITTLVFLLLTRQSVVFVLPVFFFFDSILNAAYYLGVNGYMLKFAPRENRSMFIAAIVGLSGICGGLSSLAGGAFLRWQENFSFDLGGWTCDNYRLLFAIGILLRLACIPLVHRIHEPTSAGSAAVIGELMEMWPNKLRLYPVGLYRRWQHKDG